MAKKTNYISDTDKFISNLLKEQPELITKQQILRNTWWDKNFIDQAQQQEFEESTLPEPSYAYFDYPNKHN